MDYGIARTYRLQTDTVERLDALAAELRIHQSRLVDVLLSRALDDVDDGVLVLQTRPVAYTLDRIERR
ncbi:MAG TPA: hypothetical protein DCL15_11575 [Chloroflexi bacterium]|nr:hypothetical protein [Chloroflexota bacterium]